ncbi:hypothetical protein SAMN06297468_2509 [Altererythrobacter xiamenensis]|uniref:Uncharacterized protein n=1 Tax=Altererythrobacter xiamenensis TaxID=1316679 RepID=A0A1Y6FHV4_9SPHN|nr:hypothetical protein [Altererythrobacter xiamenensis]SMQ74277.1 hypothetical protein SAMN06297468_2509 [Altererythrobacter xiamenensis]
MAETRTLGDIQTGWTYTQSGKPGAFIMPLDNPGDATFIVQDTWWQALRYALIFAHNNACEYVGGPE